MARMIVTLSQFLADPQSIVERVYEGVENRVIVIHDDGQEVAFQITRPGGLVAGWRKARDKMWGDKKS